MSSAAPPRLAMWLIRRLVPKSLRGEMAGDLVERHAAIRGSGGRRAADRWVWRQILALRPFALRSALREAGSRAPGGGGGGGRFGFGWGHDVRSGLRALRVRPWVAVTVIGTVAVAVGATTVVFSVVHGVLLAPLPYPDAGRVVQIFQTKSSWADSSNTMLRDYASRLPISTPTLRDWVEADTGFESIGAFYERDHVLRDGDGAEALRAWATTSGLFDVLDMEPRIGRRLRASDDEVGAPRVVVLSEGFWTERFAASPEVLGRDLSIDGVEHTIVGVMPGEFDPPFGTARFWLPLSEEDKVGERSSLFLSVLGRLAPRVGIEQAAARVASVQERLASEYPDVHGDVGSRLQGLLDVVAGDVRATLLFLFGSVVLVLLVCSFNITSLLSVLALRRRREMAVKLALGAGSVRLVRGLVVESAMMAALGGVSGVLLARVGLPLLLRFVPAVVPRHESIEVNGAVVAFGAGVTLLTAIVVGALPALQAARTSPREMLVGAGRSVAGDRSGNRTRGGLVVAEIAVAFMLLVGAGLLASSFVRLSSTEPGFETERLVSIAVTPDPDVYPEGKERHRFLRELRQEMRSLPGVRVTATNQVPLAGSAATIQLQVDRGEAEPGSASVMIGVVLENYFDVMGIPLLEGRGLREMDDADSPMVAVVNRAFADATWPGRSPIGRRVRYGPDEPWITIVGVVGDVLHQGLGGPADGKLYVPPWQTSRPADRLVLRVAGETGATIELARRAVASVSPTTPVRRILTLTEHISETLAVPRFRAFFVVGLAGMAGLLALLGVFSVMTLSVTQQTREIGVRVALGAGSRAVVGRVVWSGLRLGLLGVLAGALFAFPAARWLRGFLHATEPTDPATWTGIAVGVLVVTMIATLVPAHRAARIDPIRALSEE